jgi:hypothetical protein
LSDRERRDRIHKLVSVFEGDELRVIHEIAGRLAVGRAQYGVLDVSDGHDWFKEASEEYLDGAIYLAAETIRRRRE